MCVFSVQIDVSGPRSYSGSSGGPMCFRCDVNVRPSGADFVHRRVGFKRFCSRSYGFWASFVHRRVGFLRCAFVFVHRRVGFMRFCASFVHRHVGFLRCALVFVHRRVGFMRFRFKNRCIFRHLWVNVGQKLEV